MEKGWTSQAKLLPKEGVRAKALSVVDPRNGDVQFVNL